MKSNESAENYLETILILSKKKPVVRSVDIADELGFKKSSVSVAMKNLREKNHITVTPEGYIYLTEGKYHEIKRLFGARGNKIVGLERKSFGTITADDLECGEWRYMTGEEISAFKNA